MDSSASIFADRLAEVRQQIGQAARRADRDAGAVTLVVVAKSAPVAIYGVLAEAGIRDVGESRVQAAEQRRAGAPNALRWHLVGHLQSNKARRAVALFDVLHGIDSPELLQRLEHAAEELRRTPELLVQVNVSGEPGKHGLRPADLPDVLSAARLLRRARVTGLMTMAPEGADSATTRAVFRELAVLRALHASTALPLPQLSMGMSDDFTLAVEEGATMVRIGRRLVQGVLPDTMAPPHAGAQPHAGGRP